MVFSFIFLHTGSTVKLYVSVPVVLYTVFLRPGSTVHCIFYPKNPGQKPWSKIWPKIWFKYLAKNLTQL